ncbi:hypothetical protein CRG98_037502 [Punica granatum]|uniref:Uncharacterized protein n=1 Tax=Punica granatum TaxID=22663 RepID=A0A2I0IDJ2_PUNGR|nr:hypothetical protein CRG98_037502 [Punica granatum]
MGPRTRFQPDNVRSNKTKSFTAKSDSSYPSSTPTHNQDMTKAMRFADRYGNAGRLAAQRGEDGKMGDLIGICEEITEEEERGHGDTQGG